MFNLDTFKAFSRAVAVSAVAVTAIAFAGPAKAAPVQLFPFFRPLPTMTAPQPLQPYQPYQAPTYQTAPSEDQDAVETPARFRRQTVSYSTREAPGTIIIDTPNTYSITCSATARRSATASALAATVLPGPAGSR